MLAVNTSTALELAKSYLRALETNDPQRILAHFAPGAAVISPTYGRMEAEPFYEKLCADTASATISVRKMDHAATDLQLIFAHFDYTWVLKDGTTKELEILDVFRIERNTIKSLRIFADGKK